MRLTINPSLEAQQRREVSFHTALQANAEKVLAIAQGIAPVHTGDYKASLKTKKFKGSIYVTTTDFAGHMVEFGSVNNPPYAPIRRAVKAAGLRLDEAPRSTIGQPSFVAFIRNVG